MRSKPMSSTPPCPTHQLLPPGSCPAWDPALTSFHDGLLCGSVSWSENFWFLWRHSCIVWCFWGGVLWEGMWCFAGVESHSERMLFYCYTTLQDLEDLRWFHGKKLAKDLPVVFRLILGSSADSCWLSWALMIEVLLLIRLWYLLLNWTSDNLIWKIGIATKNYF